MRRLILSGLLLLGFPCAVQATQVVLTAARYSDSIVRFADELSQLRAPDHVLFVPLDQLRQQQLPADSILITLDQPSLEWRAAQTEAPPTLAIRASRVLTEQQIPANQRDNITLLWDDPPPERQLRLAKLTLTSAEKVGLLYDPQSAFLLPEYQAAAQALGLSLEPQLWHPSNARRPLLALLNRSDFLLGINAPQLYNASSAKALLLTSYEQKRPILGPNAAFVRAGSLASTYSDQNDWLAELQDWLAIAPTQWPRSAYPKHFKVLSNRQVTRALSLPPLSDDLLQQQLIEGEAP